MYFHVLFTSRIKRLQQPPAPICNPTHLSHISYPFQHQAHRQFDLVPADLAIADLLEELILCRHAQYEQDAHEVLRPREQMRDQALFVFRRCHCDRPEAGGLDGQGTAGHVVLRHQLREVQSFVHKGSVHDEAGIVEAGT